MEPKMRIGLMFMLYESIVLPLNYFGLLQFLEPEERIELSPYPLPRGYSTTELFRQPIRVSQYYDRDAILAM